MANTIRIKRRAAGGAAGAPASLQNAELAFNEQDKTLYYGEGTGGAGGSASNVIPIAGPGAFVDKSTDQTIGGTKTFSNPIAGSVTGNAATATALQTARNFAISGDVTAAAIAFNGTGNITLSANLATSGVIAGSYTKVTVDAKGRVTVGATASLSDLSSPTANFSMNGNRLTNLQDPTGAQDAATKAYVDASRAGLDCKDSVRAATTANIALSGAQTIDGVSVIAGDRVLVKNQTTASQNGIYVAAAGAWARAADADASAEVTSGMYCFVEEGTTHGNSSWVLSTANPITLNTTALTFTKYNALGQVAAGNGLTKTGDTLDVVGTNGITANADNISLEGQALAFHQLATNGMVARTSSGAVAARTITGTANRVTVANGDGVAGNPTLDISASYVGQISINTLGTITTGTWNASVIGMQYGGTGRAMHGDADGTIYKKSGTQLVAATAHTDYLNSSSTLDGGTF